MSGIAAFAVERIDGIDEVVESEEVGVLAAVCCCSIKMLKRAFILYLVPIVVLIESVMSFEKEMTISIDPRREECFYQPVKRGQVIDIEYQVSASVIICRFLSRIHTYNRPHIYYFFTVLRSAFALRHDCAISVFLAVPNLNIYKTFN